MVLGEFRCCSFDCLILDSVDSWRLKNNVLLNVHKDPTQSVGASDWVQAMTKEKKERLGAELHSSAPLPNCL